MGAVPRSLTTAVRDLVAVGVAGFVLDGALAVWVWRFDLSQLPADLAAAFGFDGRHLLLEDWHWTRTVLLWASVCWLASRARAGLRTRWVPAAVGVLVVVLRSVATLVPGMPAMWFALAWPGNDLPYRWDADGNIWLSAAHPAWGYPMLAAAALVAAAILGLRAGALPDDAASRHLTPPPRAGLPVVAAVVGLPVAGVTAGALAAYVAMADGYLGSSPWEQAGELVVPLVCTATAAALLSATGRLGIALTALAPLSVVWTPLGTWLRGGDDLLLVQTAGIVVVCVVVALWRPCAAWAERLVTPASVPREPEPLPAPRQSPDARTP